MYDTLGVASTASEKEIRTAFRELAMKNHPDRFTGEARLRAEERFQSITEAFNILANPKSRDKYDQEISKGGDTSAMDPKEIARRLAAKGAQTYRDGNPTEAVELLRSAIDHDDDCSRAHYFLGIILARVGGREREGLRHLERATTLEPLNAAIRAEAASLFLASGMASRAARFASETLELDPTNSKAQEVLAQIDGQNKPQSDGGGFLGRLRRKG